MNPRGLEHDVPAWYKMDAESGRITVSVHRDALPTVAQQLPDSLKKPLAHSKTEWTVWKYALPKGQEDSELDWENIYQGWNDLVLFFQALANFQEGTSSPEPQMVEVWLNIMTFIIRPSLARKLADSTKIKQWKNPVAKAMKDSYLRMFPSMKSLVSKRDFGMGIVEPNRLVLFNNVGFGGEDVGPEMYSGDTNDGYVLGPHNLESPVTRLALLAGLAKIDKLAHDIYNGEVNHEPKV